MLLPSLSKHKKEFQLNRLILFSDAVFAIAIPIIFLIIIIVSLFNPRYAIYIPPFTPVIMWGIGKYFKNKLRLKQ